jgi:hypothetical protein
MTTLGWRPKRPSLIDDLGSGTYSQVATAAG